ncbi:MAG: deoxyuridine 5'-triphosphate nucleotidohydrolase [Chlamydiae bacterium RIFCSPHIGHO2_12_FULL_44_59]|nr:MAG: deoxyuridine 5'-triphosphate nucleotidohydrolase [Chlamydiae bacterium RIFCSPHIGHO2_01_FULL_44_39]OGN58408.1 MAG: deoxyuridine 5'-triphosphate nucleotidohydrolase [Chlamydiae bacterium RIFCSPHIGHO2_02_FULL_45_9]OGN59473.1 MAG: deoxyuridine 5'-triphosphate nucleotidohydrolase [Chlamydiae bacterium RIFCSPHIGHO2_12_FULL_44_59]OGN67226.1 MAG: deoxyuridine 5'-triphosphate nucleotidohydrolase [Chlamydiae bacterium RIFCSPLOWO2_01_FULL_44_52]OGN67423.1 MAG: deoxyuridine 5'-triphosphate nucleoti
MTKKIPVPIYVVDEEYIPYYATECASGCDARAAIEAPLVVEPNTSAIVPTGIRVELPVGFEIQVRPRSGFAAKNQVTVLNSPGTIDCDFRGEISVILINHGKNPFVVTPKMRIAQLVLAPIVQAEFVQQASIATTQRGEGKFGHTGAN